MLSLDQLVLNLRQLQAEVIGSSTYVHVNITHTHTHMWQSLWHGLRKQCAMTNYVCLHMHTSVMADVPHKQIHHDFGFRSDVFVGKIWVLLTVCCKYGFFRFWHFSLRRGNLRLMMRTFRSKTRSFQRAVLPSILLQRVTSQCCPVSPHLRIKNFAIGLDLWALTISSKYWVLW